MAGVKGRSGGARPNTGPKPKPPTLLQIASTYDDPENFLKAVMNDAETDVKVRVDAAKALVSAKYRKEEAKGKKEQRQEDAQRVASRFAAATPPKLVAAGGMKV